jgi:DNA-binding response OmpR family regulator
MKVLIVEDEKDLALTLKKGLEENSFAVDVSYDGEEGLFMAENYPYDVLLLDIMLPKMDGLAILNTLRKKKIDMPVVMLTARGEVEDRIKGLNIGADDYIAKPFDFSELLARLRSVIRRSKGKPAPVIVIGDLTMDTNSREIRRGGRDIKLSSREYNMLEYLALNKNRVIGRTELMEHIYEMDADPDSNIIDVYINYLRNKIDKDFAVQLIHTVRGAGYVLKEGK